MKRSEHRCRRNGPNAVAARAPRTAAWLPALAVTACLLVLGATRAHAATYKWVDDQGVVHYTDRIPPEAVNKGNVVLDKNAVPIRRNDPPLTAEQRRAKAEEDARQQQIAKDRELVDRRDRALLATYTVESEIDLARNRALSTIDAQVQSSGSYTASLNKRKAELEARVAALGDKPVPPVTERELATTNAELAKQADLVAAKQREITAVNAKYDADKRRWKELRAATEAQMMGKAKPGETPGAAPAPASPMVPTTAQK